MTFVINAPSDTDGADSEAPAIQVLEDDMTVTKPEDPTKTGYEFAGWFVGETAYDFDTIVTENLTLKAKWNILTYKVTFDLNGGEGETPAEQTVEYGKVATQPEDPTRANGDNGTVYTFAGWSTTKDDKDTIFTFTTEIKADTVLYAFWSDKPVYTITLDMNYTDSTSSSVKANATSDYIITAPTATRVGYTLVGWYTDKDTKTAVDFTKAFEADTTIYAKWTPASYTITYELDGGENYTDAPTSYTIETTTIVLGVPTKEGYDFAGWYSDLAKTTKVTDIEKGSSGNKTFYATWEKAEDPVISAIKAKYTFLQLSEVSSAKNYFSFATTTEENFSKYASLKIKVAMFDSKGDLLTDKYGTLHFEAQAESGEVLWDESGWNNGVGGTPTKAVHPLSLKAGATDAKVNQLVFSANVANGVKYVGIISCKWVLAKSLKEEPVTLLDATTWTQGDGEYAESTTAEVEDEMIKVTCAAGAWNNMIYFDSFDTAEYSKLKFKAYNETTSTAANLVINFMSSTTQNDKGDGFAIIASNTVSVTNTATEYEIDITNADDADTCDMIQVFVQSTANWSPLADTIYLSSVTGR